MSDPNLAAIDLNLLVALDALLGEGSVSRAARRLGIGQPAASHALARLRDVFSDRLLVRQGQHMVPTPRGEALRAPVARLLADARRVLQHETGFETATSRRVFTLLCPDLLAPMVPMLLCALRREAPFVRLEIDHRANASVAIEDGAADLALVPSPSTGAGLVVRGLGRVRFCVVARRGHPAIRNGRLTQNRWLAYPHIVVRMGNASRSIVGSALEHAGVEREVGLIVPGFLAALLATSETDFFYCAPRELIGGLTSRLGLVTCASPISIPVLPVSAVWNERDHDDPGHIFFRGKTIATVDAAMRSAR